MPPSVPVQPSLRNHLAFILLSGLAFLVLFGLLRLALLIYNHELIGIAPASVFIEAFGNGLRFDLRVATLILLPLLLALFSLRAMAARRAMRLWLTATASFVLFLGVIELDFYREFNQRLNSLVFQYMLEDPATVMRMLWYGFPVLRLLLAWALASGLFYLVFRYIHRATLPAASGTPTAQTAIATMPRAPSLLQRGLVFLLCALLAAVAIRGTLRSGPPLRWGDAFTTEFMFANQLGLNGTLTLALAAMDRFSGRQANYWKSGLPDDEALAITRAMLLTPNDVLVDASEAAVRRDFSPPEKNRLPIKNVVVILMESFAGHSVGALGASGDITPHFDALAKEGLLFTRLFSNGTHTHQGMFATMACFPNLPGFEYLMQSPQGGYKFSGLPQLLGKRGFENLYVYNGDFAWDNQYGFFGNQGMTNFVGRNDYINPVVSDPTWGVSDQDMFLRANEELDKLAAAGKPFYALVQSLSNHTPYALPEALPVARVTGQGSLDEHLTAMRYSDWALGQFFAQAKKSPYYRETLFAIVGDHGFGKNEQLTEMNLHHFYIPLLLLAPGIQEKFGATRETVGSQVDVVPTLMGRLGGKTRHQCWGRDLLNLPENDPGFALIKPSGGNQDVALIRGNRILVKPRNNEARFYEYQLGNHASVRLITEDENRAELLQKLRAFFQTATQNLLKNTVGAE
ncbi:MAG: LTA synthase family protein [Zoogloeaceae bacterium]|jgi:phosphoglycerol transferase MdoB-like AlkP superfamily enzyme|nr:LTA synthase family protein [Zoogloeaceae bacterium]